MAKRAPSSISKTISFCFGITISAISLELLSMLAPATDIFELQKPIQCKAENNNEYIWNEKCLHRKHPYKSGKWSAGTLPGRNTVIKKTSNDAGMFSDINFKDFLSKGKTWTKVLAIGDSYVEALQAENKDTFHGRLNAYREGNKPVTSTSLGSSGMALPNYYAMLRVAKKKIETKEIYIVVPIIGNDFDESFLEFGRRGRRNGIGQFFFTEKPEKLLFIPWPTRQELKQALIDKAIQSSYTLRYIIYNLKVGHRLKEAFPSFFKRDNEQGLSPYEENPFNLVESDAPERFNKGRSASTIFIKKMSEALPNRSERLRVVFAVDCDRESIHKNTPPNNNKYFSVMRKHFMSLADNAGFKTIDLCSVFQQDYRENKKRFNSIYDGHWNSYGHKVVADAIAREIGLTRALPSKSRPGSTDQ